MPDPLAFATTVDWFSNEARSPTRTAEERARYALFAQWMSAPPDVEEIRQLCSQPAPQTSSLTLNADDHAVPR